MRNPLTMFREKRNGKDEYSMTRVVAFAFAIAFLLRLSRLSLLGAAIGWPDAFLGVMILLAVPIKDLFAGKDGASLLGKLLDRFGVGAVGDNVAAAAIRVASQHRFNPDK